MRDEAEVERDDEPRVIVEKRSGGGLTGFLIGVAVGAGLALLFAPQSGAETRQRLARGARRARRAAEEAAEGVSDAVGESFEAARQRVAEGLDSARDRIAAKRQQVERAARAGRDAAQQARQDIERRLAETKAAYEAGARVAREGKARDD